MCDMDMDYEMELDMDGSGEIEDDIMFESLESIDETDFGTLEPIENTLYDEFNDSEIPEYSMDIFSDTALTEIELDEMEATDTENLGQETEQMSDEIGEQNIDYTEIYDEIQQEALEQGFEDFQIDADPERLENSLENFDKAVWDTYSLEEQKDSMKDLADYVVDVIGFDNPPRIDYYNNEQEGDFGGYDSATNTLHINEYMLYNSNEAADTIAHELWHAHQHECATDPHCARDYQYQYNFENYIPPALGQEAYEAQLVEAEARAFAAQFKDRLEITKGRSR